MGNPGHGNVEFKEKSGQAIAYQTDVKIRATYFEPWRVGKEDTQIGQKIHWQVHCSALGPPGGKITSFLRYGEGIDRAMEVFTLAKDIGLVDQAGAWYTIACVPDSPKFQGEEKARNYIASNPEVCDSIWNQVKETMGM
jgi:recombination protein RecA